MDVAEAFAGVNKVIIGGSKVAFVDYRYAAAQAKGSFLGGGTFGGKSAARIRLVGVTDAEKQQITDAVYSDFVKKLEAAGYDVLDRRLLEGAAGCQDVPSYPVPYRDDPMGSNTELSLFVPSSFGKVRFFQGDAAIGVSVPFSVKTINVIASEYASKDAVKGLSANYIVDFAATENYAGRTYANVGVSDVLSLAPGSSVAIIGGHGGTFSKDNGRIHITSGKLSTEQFGEVVDSTPDINSTVETEVNVLSAVAGMGTNVSRQYEVKADASR